MVVVQTFDDDPLELEKVIMEIRQLIDESNNR